MRRSTVLSLPLQLVVFPVHSNGRLLGIGPKISTPVGLKVQEVATTLAYNAAVLISVLKVLQYRPGASFLLVKFNDRLSTKVSFTFQDCNNLFTKQKKVYFYSLKNDGPCYKAFFNSTRHNTISQSIGRQQVFSAQLHV